MKKKRIIAAAIFLCIVVATSITVFAVSGDRNKESGEEVLHFGLIENKDALPTKTINHLGRTVNLEYRFTNNHNKAHPKDRADSYGTYDIYTEKGGTEYYFLYNTDTLCGTLRYDFVTDPSSLGKDIGTDLAIATAREYLAKVLPEAAGKYVYDKYAYDSFFGLYDISLYLPVMGYKSDDEVKVYVRLDGEVVAYSAFYLNRYEKYALWETNPGIERAQAELMAKIEDAYDSFQIEEIRFSVNNDGDPVLSAKVTVKALSSGEAFESLVTVQQIIKN